MASKPSSSGTLITDINITPFVDIVLVLLIIFMITAPELYKKGIKLQLPQAQTGGRVEQMSLSFFIQRDGQIVFESKPISPEELDQAVTAALAKDPRAEVTVAADANVSHGVVVRLLDQIKSKGITNVSIMVESK